MVKAISSSYSYSYSHSLSKAKPSPPQLNPTSYLPRQFPFSSDEQPISNLRGALTIRFHIHPSMLTPSLSQVKPVHNTINFLVSKPQAKPEQVPRKTTNSIC